MGFVALTDKAENSLVDKITEAVGRAQQITLLEELKRYARAESDLIQAREVIARRDQAIAELQARVNQLTGIINTISQGTPAPAPVFNPYNNNGPAPTGHWPIVTTHAMPLMPERVAASAPFPEIPVSANGASATS